MGLSTTNSERATYLNILEGKLTKKTNQENVLAVPRVNKKGETVYEIRYDKLEANITSMRIEKDDFGKKLVVELQEAADKYILQIPVESKYFDHFAAKIANVDLKHLVIIAPYSFTPKGETGKRTGLNFYQHGNKVEYYFTETEPKGKPMASGKLDEDEWKIFKMQERKFYCDFITKVFSPEQVSHHTQPVQKDNNDDGLPF